VIAAAFCCIGLSSQDAMAEACSVSMTAMAFGTVDVTTGSAVDTTATMSFSCSGMVTNSSYNFCVSIESGSFFSGSTRQMDSSGSKLNYGIYSDAARATTWGSYASGFGGSGISVNRATGGSSTLNFNLTVYGRIFASQTTALAGSYSSSFTASPFVRWDENPPAGSPCLSSTKTLQTNFSATATVVASCNVSATNLNFGTIGVLSSNLDSSNTVTIQCTSGTPYNVGLNAGTGAGATVAARKMTSGANTATYSLYSNAGRTTVWGNTIGTDTVTGTGTGSNQNLTVYGRVPVQSTPPPATYSDTVIVTVTF
jgi:spore coat protein U-like protein